MGMKQGMSRSRLDEDTYDVMNEKESRVARYVEKWSRVPEIGSGIRAMDERKAANLAIMLETQAKRMGRMTEAQYSSAFAATPENMIRLVRLAYPNSIREKLFTEFNKAVA